MLQMTNKDRVNENEQATINEGIFIEIEIRAQEVKIMATGSERGNSVDVTLWRDND